MNAASKPCGAGWSISASTILSDAHLTYIHSAEYYTSAGVGPPIGSSWSLSGKLIGPDLLLWRNALPLAPTRIGRATIRLCVFPSLSPGIRWGPVLYLLLTAPPYCQARIEILHMLLIADQTHHLTAPTFFSCIEILHFALESGLGVALEHGCIYQIPTEGPNVDHTMCSGFPSAESYIDTVT